MIPLSVFGKVNMTRGLHFVRENLIEILDPSLTLSLTCEADNKIDVAFLCGR